MTLTASEMAQKGHKNRTREDYVAAAKKAKKTKRKKYGKDFMKRVRKGEKIKGEMKECEFGK